MRTLTFELITDDRFQDYIRRNLQRRIDYLEKRFEFFIKNGLKDKIKTIILNKIEAFEDDEEDIDLEELKGM